MEGEVERTSGALMNPYACDNIDLFFRFIVFRTDSNTVQCPKFT